MVGHPRERSGRNVGIRRINKMLINLVRYHKGVILQRKLPDGSQFLPGKNLSARVGRIADDDGFGSLPEAVFQQFQIKNIRGRDKRNKNRICPGEDGIGPVIFIKW